MRKKLRKHLEKELRLLLEGKKKAVYVPLSEFEKSNSDFLDRLSYLEEEVVDYLVSSGFDYFAKDTLKECGLDRLARQTATLMEQYVWSGKKSFLFKEENGEVIGLKIFYYEDGEEDCGLAIGIEELTEEEKEKIKEILREKELERSR